MAYRVDPLRPPNVTAYGLALHAAGDTSEALALLEDAVERWPDDPNVLAIATWAAVTAGDMPRVDRLLVHHRPERYSAPARLSTERAFLATTAYRHREGGARESAQARLQED